jgi:hypothetical protein
MKMDQGMNLGQLYNVHNKINIYTQHSLDLLIYYDNNWVKIMSYWGKLTAQTRWCTIVSLAIWGQSHPIIFEIRK